MAYSLSPMQPQQILNAETATTASGILVLRGQCDRLTVALQSHGTTSGGAVTVEEAYYDPNGPVYSGTWSVLQATNASTFSGSTQTVIHWEGSFWAVRVRISSTITGGGSVSAWAWGN